jgi:hypothetical protein
MQRESSGGLGDVRYNAKFAQNAKFAHHIQSGRGNIKERITGLGRSPPQRGETGGKMAFFVDSAVKVC